MNFILYIYFIGGIAAALTTPIDVTKTQIMLANSSINQNFSSVFINIYKTRGINGQVLSYIILKYNITLYMQLYYPY